MQFLVKCMHIYKPLCWLVGWLISWSVSWLVGLLVADCLDHATNGNWPCSTMGGNSLIR